MTLPGWPPAWDEKIKRYLQLDGETESKAEYLWLEALDLAQPSTWRQVISINEFHEIFKPHAQASHSLQRLLKSCGQVALMVVSLGAHLEEQARELLSQREVFGGFMLDRMGSYLAEWCMSSLDCQVAESLGAVGLKTTRRYSPGYQDFSLEAQKVFIELAAEAMSGLRLRPGNLLTPEKSITALKGTGFTF